jgi:hypothetical protein
MCLKRKNKTTMRLIRKPLAAGKTHHTESTAGTEPAGTRRVEAGNRAPGVTLSFTTQRKRPRGGGLFSFSTLYIQNISFGRKQCQLSLGRVAGKWCVMRGHYFGFWTRVLTDFRGAGEERCHLLTEAPVRRFRNGGFTATTPPEEGNRC